MRTFKRIYIEITNVCNLNCGFCPKTSREPEFMKIDLFRKIIDEITGYSEHLYFHVMGEPLLHPDIDTFLDLCGEKGFKVNLTTNGTLIERAKDMLLSKSALRSVNISTHIFDGSSDTDAIDRYLDGVFAFTAGTGEAHGPIVSLRLWNMEKPHAPGRKIQNASGNEHMLRKIENFFNVSRRIEDIPSEGRGVKLKDNVYLSLRSFFDWPDKGLPDISEDGFCLGLRQQAAILADGTVVPCCLDSEGTIALGNINVTGFKEIIEGKRAMALYDGFSERKAVEALCRKCGYRERFA
ncbi:MAG: radical SAM protein [Candidatus Omnitrophota bacterium]|nr:radical SAM protein [Candidatus Omnitrophota bacterium]